MQCLGCLGTFISNSHIHSLSSVVQFLTHRVSTSWDATLSFCLDKLFSRNNDSYCNRINGQSQQKIAYSLYGKWVYGLELAERLHCPSQYSCNIVENIVQHRTNMHVTSLKSPVKLKYCENDNIS